LPGNAATGGGSAEQDDEGDGYEHVKTGEDASAGVANPVPGQWSAEGHHQRYESGRCPDLAGSLRAAFEKREQAPGGQSGQSADDSNSPGIERGGLLGVPEPGGSQVYADGVDSDGP
jgi:hypothetical protein